MRHRKSLRELVRTSSKIKVRDWSEYDPDHCRDGGQYGFGQNWVRHGNNWQLKEWTTGDFCPYCHSFGCCGDCREAEQAEAAVYTNAEVLTAIRKARLNDEEIEFF